MVQRARRIVTCAGTHGGNEVALLLVQGGHALHHVAVGFRVAVLEGQLLQLLLDGVQPKQPCKRRKDLHTKSLMCEVAIEHLEGCRCGRAGGEWVGLQGGAQGEEGGGGLLNKP